MDSWSVQTPTPNLKFEGSPTESLLSTPGEMYPSLFGSEQSPTPTTLNPLEMMSPQSFRDATPDLSVLAALAGAVTDQPATLPETTPSTPAATSEKKPVKKRKSWGQVLPEPKTNLPPRKRAKTEDEKEQRRVERVLRNRRAAQSSRERKRLEVEGLEKRNQLLEQQLRLAQEANLALIQELQKLQRTSGVMTRTSPSLDALRTSGLTFSQELFSSQDGHGLPAANTGSLEQLLSASLPTNNTVNPASLSPSLTPVAEAEDEEDDLTAPAPTTAEAAATPVNMTPDATQHPAAMLCEDLQCPLAEVPQWMAASRPQQQAALALFQFLLMSTQTALSLCQRPLTQIAMSLRGSFSLPPTPAILNTIILLVTNPSPSTSTTSSSTTTSSRQSPSSSSSTPRSAARPRTRCSSTLRLKFLRKILTCSPTLARPLMDATVEALRLVSSQGQAAYQVVENVETAAAAASREVKQSQQGGGRTTWWDGMKLPSQEVLITLLWVLRAEERRLQAREQASSLRQQQHPGKLSLVPRTMAPADKYSSNAFILKVQPKRSYGGLGGSGLKRRRV